ncbi:unnamed protein product [Amaranthus hypochondriacus]
MIVLEDGGCGSEGSFGVYACDDNGGRAMGRRGRLAKVKVVPRKPSLSGSSHDGDGDGGSSASTPRLAIPVSNVGLGFSSTPVPVGDNRVGLSWVSVLKGGGSCSATSVGATVGGVRAYGGTGDGGLKIADGGIGDVQPNSFTKTPMAANNNVLAGQPKVSNPSLVVDDDGFRPYRKGFKAKQVEPIEEGDEVDTVSETGERAVTHPSDNTKEALVSAACSFVATSQPIIPESDLAPIAVEVANGFSILAVGCDGSLERDPNIALGADPIPGNG